MMTKTNWRDIYHALREDILEASSKNGSRLPSQAALSRHFGVSRHTIRRALAALAEDGLISSAQGRTATRVSRQVLYQIGSQTRLATGLRAQGHAVEIRTLRTDAKRRLPQPVADMFTMPAGATAPFAEFMHVVDGIPTALGRHYFDGQRFPNIVTDATKSNPSVPEAFSDRGVRTYFRAATTIEVRPPTPYEALALEISPSQAVLRLLGRNVDQHGTPIEVTEAIVRSDTVRLEVEAHQVTNLA